MSNGHQIRMGVETDQYGKAIAYHFWNRHPAEYSISPLNRIRVPAEEVIHLYTPERVMQTRGMTQLAPSLLAVHHLGRYLDAELIASRVAANKMGFFVKKEGDSEYTGERDAQDNIRMKAEEGTFEQLPTGLEFQPFDPQHPTSAFGPFVKQATRMIGAGLDVSYESLANDREGVNYSSIRAGILDERDTWYTIQQWFIEEFNQVIFERWLEIAWLAGRVVLDQNRIPQDLIDLESFLWHPRGFAWVDPLKDMQAADLAVQNGYESQTQIMAENGNDFEETMKQRKYEQDFIAQLGLKIGTDTKGVADTASDDQQSDGEDTGSDKKKTDESN
jgi:lambda family phage portal protein